MRLQKVKHWLELLNKLDPESDLDIHYFDGKGGFMIGGYDFTTLRDAEGFNGYDYVIAAFGGDSVLYKMAADPHCWVNEKVVREWCDHVEEVEREIANNDG